MIAPFDRLDRIGLSGRFGVFAGLRMRQALDTGLHLLGGGIKAPKAGVSYLNGPADAFALGATITEADRVATPTRISRRCKLPAQFLLSCSTMIYLHLFVSDFDSIVSLIGYLQGGVYGQIIRRYSFTGSFLCVVLSLLITQ